VAARDLQSHDSFTVNCRGSPDFRSKTTLVVAIPQALFQQLCALHLSDFLWGITLTCRTRKQDVICSLDAKTSDGGRYKRPFGRIHLPLKVIVMHRNRSGGNLFLSCTKDLFQIYTPRIRHCLPPCSLLTSFHLFHQFANFYAQINTHILSNQRCCTVMGKQDKDAISYSSFCMNFALILIF